MNFKCPPRCAPNAYGRPLPQPESVASNSNATEDFRTWQPKCDLACVLRTDRPMSALNISPKTNCEVRPTEHGTELIRQPCTTVVNLYLHFLTFIYGLTAFRRLKDFRESKKKHSNISLLISYANLLPLPVNGKEDSKLCKTK